MIPECQYDHCDMIWSFVLHISLSSLQSYPATLNHNQQQSTTTSWKVRALL